MYEFARVILNPLEITRKGSEALVEALVPGDILELAGACSKDHFLRNNIVYFRQEGGINSTINTSFLEPLSRNDQAKLHFSIGDEVIVRLVSSRIYGLTVKIVDFYNEKVYYTDYGSLPYCCFELKQQAQCICNFFEREAYGCRCGRILG